MEKLTHTIGSFKVTEADKKELNELRALKDRKENELIRYMIKATLRRRREGKVKDEELY